MSLNQVKNVVLLFSNPVRGVRRAGTAGATHHRRRLTALPDQLAYSDVITQNFTTLSKNYAPSDGTIQGLLYTPDIDPDDDCQWRADQYIPRNATKQVNLPSTAYNLVALAPWIDSGCTRSLLASTRADQLRAFIFYLPNNDASQPPAADDPIWNLNDDGTNSWMSAFHYPIYVVPGAVGTEMMHQLSFYSGNVTQVPSGTNISETYHPSSSDYVRIWTELKLSYDAPTFPVWAYVLIIVGVCLFIVAGTSILMHSIQNRRRALLRRRVKRGEIDLERMGIKRVTVPFDHITQFPLFTYNYNPTLSPTSPQSSSTTQFVDSRSSYTTSRGHQPPSSHLSSNTDHQPLCHICLDHYEPKITVIREIACGHIFHPECIDEFLGEVSSLCPICKASMFPRGHAPRITNGMVRRERATRRLRPQIFAKTDSGRPRRRIASWGSTVKKHLCSPPSSPAHPPSAVIELPDRTKGPEATRQRMQELLDPIDDRSDDGLPPWKRAVTKVFPWP